MKKREQNNIKFHIIALASHGSGISGGDRIWIELSRRWSKKFSITIHTWVEGREMAERQTLNGNKNLNFKIYSLGPFCNFGFAICYFSRIIKSTLLGLSLRLENKNDIYIYNASEFWMDAIPCIILKIRYPNIRWIASWYQTAPNPIKGFTTGQRENSYRLAALVYWLVQLPIKPFVKIYADKVVVNNEEEKKQFLKHTSSGSTIVLIGAVPLERIKSWRASQSRMSKRYDAVFQGRFHPQKGVIELIDIWRTVVQKMPKAKLAMIGDGPLMEKVKMQIKNAKLENNVSLLGYVFDGPEKYEIFAESKLVVHPAFFDSGGMASAEAMAFGIPCVGFSLPSYESYYPRGMVKVRQNNLSAFANAILDLLSNDSKRKKIGEEAYRMIEKNYSWEKRADEILNSVIKS